MADSAVKNDTYLEGRQLEAQARQDYTARELDVAAGERVRVDRELAGWLWVHNEAGQSGWIPASCIASPS